VNDADVVGEGFSVQNGILHFFIPNKFGSNSSIFNCPAGSEYHDTKRTMHEVSEYCVKKIVKYWKNAGSSWVRQRNFEVKELMKHFDTDKKKKPFQCNIL
jgi:hypothetical protein